MKTTLKLTTLAAVVATLIANNAFAGTDSAKDMKDSKDLKDIAAPVATEDKDWTIELGSGVLWSNVRATGDKGYTLVPVDVTASLKLDDVSNDKFLGGIFRGNSEFFFRADYTDVAHGPENQFGSLIVGPRYNFVQPNWVVIPYIEGGVGVLFADSKPQFGGLGQDFNFTFITGAGIKYNFNEDWFLRLGAEYQHISNAGLSEPTNANHPIDALGPKLTVGYSF